MSLHLMVQKLNLAYLHNLGVSITYIFIVSLWQKNLLAFCAEILVELNDIYQK